MWKNLMSQEIGGEALEQAMGVTSGYQACIFLPLFLGGTERNHQKNPNFFWLVMLSSWTTPEPEFQRQMIYPPVYPIIWAGWYLA